MNHNLNLNELIRKAAATLRYPGPWAEYRGERIDKFLLGLTQKPAVLDRTAWGTPYWREPVKDALAAMPWLYRAVSQRIIALSFYNRLVNGSTELDPVEVGQMIHERMTYIRSVIAGRLGVDLGEEFAEGTTRIIVGQDIETEHGEVAQEIGEPMWVSCSLENVVDDFASALLEARQQGEPNWATYLLVEIAGQDLQVDWDGWDKVALDNVRGAEDKARLTEQLASDRRRLWGVNKAYRLLVSEARKLEKLHAYWSWRLDRATRTEERPSSEPYAGGGTEMVQIGRIDHEVGGEWTDMNGRRDGGPEREVLKLIETEQQDLAELLSTLEKIQERQEGVWKLLGHAGVPYYYERSVSIRDGVKIEEYTSYSIHQKAEAEQARERQAEAWIKARMAERSKAFSQEELELLATLADFSQQ